jgi:multicomponent Na+:H+ antiporter subunit B
MIFLFTMRDKVMEVSIKLLFHISVFYALFIHFHGEESAGGGFQAGAILASVFFVYQFVFDEEEYLVTKKLSFRLLFAGIIAYFGFGLITMLAGGNFLEFEILQKFGFSASSSHKIGIFIIEFGVILVVTMGLLQIGYSFKKVFDTAQPNTDL